MKTIIAIDKVELKIAKSKIINIASEFFGIPFDPKKKTTALFLTFLTKKAAREFRYVMREMGIDALIYDKYLNKFI